MTNTDAQRYPWRGLLLGLLLIPPTTLFGVYAYIVAQATLWGQTSLLRGPVFLLFFLVLLNLGLQRWAPRLKFSQTDLLLVYTMQCVATALSGIGWSQFLVPSLGSPKYYATNENGMKAVWEHIPGSWWIHDPNVINALYRGHSSLYAPANLQAVVRPFCHWSLVMILLATAAVCVAQLLREQWVSRERLTFPLSYLPLEMTHGGGERKLWANRLLWAGFAVAAFIDCMNAMHVLVPTIPEIVVKPIGGLRIDQAWTTKPLSGMRPFVLSFYPFMIGIGFLLTLDVSFSCWAWYLLLKVVSVLGVQWALCDNPLSTGSFPYIPEQSVGAFAALAGLAVYRSRRDIAAAFTRRPERVPDRWAVIGLFGSALGLWLLIHTRGLPSGLLLGWLVIYLVYAVGCSRIVSETGSGWTWAPRLSPHDVLLRMPGAGALNPKQATLFAWLMPFDMDLRDAVMPQQLQGMKLQPDDGGAGRPLLLAMVVTIVVGVVAAMWAHLHVYFQYGIDTAVTRRWPAQVGRTPFDVLVNQLKGAQPGSYSLGGVVFGAAMLLGLVALRTHVLTWPLHPIGYALALTPSLDYLWMPFLVAWAIKSAVLRWGGMKAYRQLMPFFLGLILGDYVVPLLWALYGTLTNQQMYLSFPH